MSVTVPPIFTPIRDEEIASLVSSQEETLRKVFQNLNFFGNMAPLGTIKFVHINQFGVKPVNSQSYQFCDGSEITSPTSPLRTVGLNLRFTPNLLNNYPRAAVNPTGNATGGTNVWNLKHSHGGTTGGMDSLGSFNGTDGDERKSTETHTHDMTDDLSNGTYESPAYFAIAAYMKIR